jgi:BirA family biotin operon repressor/biotin-[acetyl-CoA-carboxylase] ligase
LSLVVGLAVRDAVATAIGSDAPMVKWPNDVHVGGKKIAGILVESSVAGAKVENLIVGIGINVHTRQFPDDFAATSVALEGGAMGREDILAHVLAGLERDMERAAHLGLEGGVHARLSKYDALRGRRVEADGLSGVASGIDVEGRLIVTRDDSVVDRIVSGEVHLRVE